MEEIPTCVCGLLVALGDVEVLGVDGAPGELLGVHIRGLYDVDCPQLAGTYATDLAVDLATDLTTSPTPTARRNCAARAALWPAGALLSSTGATLVPCTQTFARVVHAAV